MVFEGKPVISTLMHLTFNMITDAGLHAYIHVHMGSPKTECLLHVLMVAEA